MLHGYLLHPLRQCHHQQTPLGLQQLHCLFATEEGIHCFGFGIYCAGFTRLLSQCQERIPPCPPFLKIE